MRYAMKFNIKLTENDYINLNKAHMQNSKMFKTMQTIIKAVMLAILAFLICTFFYFNDTGSLILPIVESAIFGFIVLFYAIFMLPRINARSVKRTIKLMKKDGKLPFDEESEIEFTNDKIIDKTENSERQINYSSIEKLIITDKYIFIYIDSARVTIIPLDQLNNEKDNVVAMLEEKVNAEKIRR